jgi:uncharacterized protein (TIGR03435 family)
MRQAIEEQLGLRMDKVRAPLPTLVIEKAKTPTDD